MLHPRGPLTIGFATFDGSQRTEVRNNQAKVTEKYGLLVENDKQKIADHVLGPTNHVSERSNTSFKRKRTQADSELRQRLFDFQYRSVDDNKDGIPDDVLQDLPLSFSKKKQLVRLFRFIQFNSNV